MISFDLECSNGHRFEGSFRDYSSYTEQFERGMVRCPLCDSREIKRLYTGCSIQAKPVCPVREEGTPNVFEVMRMIRRFVETNFENVGRDFAETARSIYYGALEAKNIYGESTRDEIKELLEEGIGIIPLPDVEKLEN